MVVNTGGTFNSLVGARVSPWVIRGQATFWIAATIGGLALLASRRQLRGALALGSVALFGMFVGAHLGTRSDGLTFVQGPSDVRCEPIDSGVPLCLAPGYESARAAAARALDAAFAPGAQRPAHAHPHHTGLRTSGSSTMWVDGSEVLHPRVGDSKAASPCQWSRRDATTGTIPRRIGRSTSSWAR